MTTIFEEKKDSPKVFISYSYDSDEHIVWIEELVNKLRRNAGVNATIDKFLLNKTIDLDEIMIRGFKESDKIVIVLTKNYASKAEDTDGDTGVRFEARLATIITRNNALKNKLIFIKRDSSCDFKEVFPFIFQDHYAIEMSNDSDFEEKFKELYHRLWNKPFNEPVPIGENPFEQNKNIQINNKLEICGVNVHRVIEKSGFDPYNVFPQDLEHESLVIWPVVPRQHITLIHLAQIEVIRLLSLLGWKAKIIIANCGGAEVTPNKIDVEFKDKLDGYLQKKSISDYEIDFLNQYFSPSYQNGNKIFSNFVKLSSRLKISQLNEFNVKNKTYDKAAQLEIQERNTLKYISPLLTWSASIFEASEFFTKNPSSKAIIIAGRDEESQWSHVISEIEANIGAIFIPILKQDDENTLFQEKKLTLLSKSQLERELGKGNIDKWLFQAFISLAAFPYTILNLAFCKNKSEQCNTIDSNCLECLFPDDKEKFNEDVDRKKFAEEIYAKTVL